MKNNVFNKNLHEKLRNLKNNQSREYWNILIPKNTNQTIQLTSTPYIITSKN